MNVVFKNTDIAAVYGINPYELGLVTAETETDGIKYLTVLFPGVEVNGLNAALFEAIEENITPA